MEEWTYQKLFSIEQRIDAIEKNIEVLYNHLVKVGIIQSEVSKTEVKDGKAQQK